MKKYSFVWQHINKAFEDWKSPVKCDLFSKGN